MDAHSRLEQLGLELPNAPKPAAAYQPWATLPTATGDVVFTAGQLPLVDGALAQTGKLGVDLDTAAGTQLARTAALNVLAVAAAALGDLNRVRIVKVTVFVASGSEFTEQHLVANGASELFAAVLGDAGVHARSAVGVPSLPLNSPVEVEAILTAR